MFVNIVSIHVKKEFVDEFIKATNVNQENSIKEEGVFRFDFLQQIDEPSRFVLYEAFRSENDVLMHKETEHYKNWQKDVESLLVSPRTKISHTMIKP